MINLKAAAVKAAPELVTLELHERLPAHVKPVCKVSCKFSVEEQSRYYLLTLSVNSNLKITCQRCLKEFNYQYANETQLAICSSEEMAERLMSQYESVIADNNEVDLVELVTDELHLYTPELHSEIADCDDINHFIGADNI
ncbi:metal-binding protein [Legionella jamestowniensis]|uniref:Large ribosomal RNA subunit accumulation protein YceD n=1 Tax=Legionella jamestowniensis TaxID=455 RepID=A0ABX2XXL8_9GAMM|nr:metal-binding protein [Legionella jamestowniensis]